MTAIASPKNISKSLLSAFLVFIKILIISALYESARAQTTETDPKVFLNEALLKKSIKVQRMRDDFRVQKDCPWSGEPRLPRCTYQKVKVQVPFTDDARVVNSQIVSTSDVTFDMAQIVTLPGKALIQRVTYRNCGKGTLTAPVSLTISGTSGWTMQKAQTISSTTTVSISGKFDIGIAGASSSVTETIGLSNTTTKAESHSETVTRTFAGTLSNLQRGDSGVMQLLAYQTTASVPFHATVVVDGDLEPNNSGQKKASDLLKAEERTLPFTGTITIENLSDAYIDNQDAPQRFRCGTGPKPAVNAVIENFVYPANDLDPKFRKRFKKAEGAQQNVAKTQPRARNLSTTISGQIIDFNALAVNLDEGPSIGVPDGISYTITSTSEVTRMDPACGFNDVGAANGAKYTVENRHYENHANGELVSSWDQPVETFKECAAGP